MPTQPDILEQVRRRLMVGHVLEAVSLGALVAAVISIFARLSSLPQRAGTVTAIVLSAAIALMWFAIRRPRHTSRIAALAIESARPECENVVVTAVELAAHPDRAQPWIRRRVLTDADRMLATLDAKDVVTLRSTVLLSVASLAISIAIVFGVHQRAVDVLRSSFFEEASRAHAVAGEPGIVATLEPPRYTRLPSTRITQPKQIDAIQGTRLRIEVTGTPVSRVRFGSNALPTQDVSGKTVAELSLRETGYLAVESNAGPALIPVIVTPDRAPAIHIERPGRDLLLPDARAPVAVETTASDDFGLRELTVRYTKVSGSGEQFEFVEGRLPLTLDKGNPRAWRGRSEFQLAKLALEPGDSLVYRVVARDEREGTMGEASSETFFIEIAGPGQVALEGFEMPPDRERFALSQQMIVLKIQRLRDRERGLTREVLQEQTGAIAAEQRAVRANFVFLMGGHIEDEEEEAEQAHEIQEGRLENTARREISAAIGHMSRAEQQLVAIDTGAALTEARLAVAALQRAFGRNRYILRTLAVRNRIDPSRRLTGKLDDAKGSTRELPAARDDRAEAARRLLAETMSLVEEWKTSGTVPAAATLASLSERALAIEPADPAWQGISRQLTAARDSIASRDPRRAEDQLRAAAALMVLQAQKSAMPRGVEGAAGTLRGAWAEELRQSRATGGRSR